MTHSGLRTNFNASFTSQKRTISYPYIFIPKFGNEIALMVTCLQPGPVPLVLRDKGVLKQVGTCAVSALELQKLLRVYSLEVTLSATDIRKINTNTDILEVLPWMVSLLSS